MRSIYTIFFVLNIYTIFSALGQSNTLTLQIVGNNTQETAVIDSLFYPKTFSDLNSLKTQVTLIKDSLISKGFIDARLESLKKTDSITHLASLKLDVFYKYLKIKVPEEERLYYFLSETGIDVKGNIIVIETAFAKALLEKLTVLASNNGNPFATFQLKNISKNADQSLSALLNFKSKRTRSIDEIVIKGYEDFPKTYLKRFTTLKKGATFNQEELLKQNARLNSLPFASATKEPEALFTKDSTTVYFYLERQNTNRFDGFLGFASNQENDRLRLDGYIDLQLTNNLNYGETLLLNYKSDGEDQSQLNATITLPYLLKSPIGLEANLSLFRKDSTFSTTSQKINLLYQVSPSIKTGAGYQFIQSENLQETLDINDNTIDYTTNKFIVSANYLKNQNDYFFPIKATFSTNASLGNRETDIKERQIGLEVEGSNAIILNKKNSFFLKGTLRSLWSSNYVTNELYRFGGITSIRGFEENSIFANFLGTLNTEYRYVLNQSLYIHSLLDLAYFENDVTSQRSKLFSFGLGAGIRTKAGVLRVIIANGKNENQNFDFNNTKLHFQLAIRF